MQLNNPLVLPAANHPIIIVTQCGERFEGYRTRTSWCHEPLYHTNCGLTVTADNMQGWQYIPRSNGENSDKEYSVLMI